MFSIIFPLVILLPLTTFITIFVAGRFLVVYGSMIISVANISVSFILSVILFFGCSFTTQLYVPLWHLVSAIWFDIDFGIRYDPLSAIMFLVVGLVSTCVHLYSCVYMYTDPFLTRFMSYLSLFTFFMLLLVSSSNFLVLFLGWEVLVLCSYLLIGFWYTRAQAGKAATKAFLINKVGDLFLLSGISVILVNFHTLDFATLTGLVPYYPRDILCVIAVFLFLVAVVKSAQIGLHTWLPYAM